MLHMKKVCIRKANCLFMRYLDIKSIVNGISKTAATALQKKHSKLIAGNDAIKVTIINRGSKTWSQVKSKLEKASNRKCWYTESQNPGCVNDVDHFRPKGIKLDDAGNREFWYWFLAFDPENYRLSCQFANRPNANPLLNGTGGKHQHFPLLNNQAHATSKAGILNENPILLDPCVEGDCNLLQFQPDGRPVVANAFKGNATACLRVERSNLLLNLDYPTFNEDREKLYNWIKKLIKRGDGYPEGSAARVHVEDDLRELMHQDSEYSKAAECFIRCFRDRQWVEALLY